MRFDAAYRGEGPPGLTMRLAAVPLAVQTVQTVQTVQPSVQTVRAGLCQRHGLRKVFVSKYRWRCRR